jgi:hypothetical protein
MSIETKERSNEFNYLFEFNNNDDLPFFGDPDFRLELKY